MRIGLTGGYGCGKSTVLEVFAEQGARTIDCDRIVRELLMENEGVQEAIRIRFGPGVFNEQRMVDREEIAAIVFRNSAERLWLEDLLHPLVRDHWETLIQSESEGFWVVEIPLLFEKNLDEQFDFTVCVSANPANQLLRLKAKGLKAIQVQERIQQQLPLSEKVTRADFVITNNGSTAFLRKQALSLITRLCPAL